MDDPTRIHLTIDSAEGQLVVSGPLSLLRAYLQALHANGETASDAMIDHEVAMSALTRIATDNRADHYARGVVTTALAKIQHQQRLRECA
jgi:hypothetical protein